MLKDKIGAEIVERIASKLDDEDRRTVRSAMDALGMLKDKIGVEVVERIASKLDDEDIKVVWRATEALRELKDKVGVEIVRKLVSTKTKITYDLLKLMYQEGKLECLE